MRGQGLNLPGLQRAGDVVGQGPTYLPKPIGRRTNCDLQAVIWAAAFMAIRVRLIPLRVSDRRE